MNHRILGGLLALLLGSPLVPRGLAASAGTAGANPAAPPSAPAQRGAADLEKLAMPIALHPDPLISILLPAAVYPLEIVQAARFVKDTNNVAKVDAQPWDENVKAVAKFPALIAQLDADLPWTIELGQAFLDQPKELMDAIQALRSKAQKAGTLQTTPQQVVIVTNTVVVVTNVTQVVTVTNQVVQVQPANPQVVYVPTYPSTVYYPPPSYVYDPYAPLVTFGVGMAVGAIIANNCDWHGGGIYVGGGGMVIWGGGSYHGDVDIDIDNDINIDRGNRPEPRTGNRATTTGTGTGTGTTKATQQKWQPDQSRLRTSGAPSASTSAGSREARGWGSPTGARPSSGTVAPRPATGSVAARPTTGTVGTRPATGTPAVNRAGATPSANVARPTPAPRPTPSPSVNRSSSGGGSAFGGVNQGSASRGFSNRGAASRGGGMRGGGRR